MNNCKKLKIIKQIFNIDKNLIFYKKILNIQYGSCLILCYH